MLHERLVPPGRRCRATPHRLVSPSDESISIATGDRCDRRVVSGITIEAASAAAYEWMSPERV